MKPIGKNIIIHPIDEEIKTQSGLLLSSEDTNQLRYKKGIINSDDTIYYDKRAGFTMLINNEPFTIIQEKDVVVVV